MVRFIINVHPLKDKTGFRWEIKIPDRHVINEIIFPSSRLAAMSALDFLRTIDFTEVIA